MFIPDLGFRIRIFSSRIPDTGSKRFRIPDPDPHQRITVFLTQDSIFNPRFFLSSRKYDPVCSSRIPDPVLDFYPSRILDPGVKKTPDPGSGFITRFLTGDL
jgi:hypothetical protein